MMYQTIEIKVKDDGKYKVKADGVPLFKDEPRTKKDINIFLKKMWEKIE